MLVPNPRIPAPTPPAARLQQNASCPSDRPIRSHGSVAAGYLGLALTSPALPSESPPPAPSPSVLLPSRPPRPALRLPPPAPDGPSSLPPPRPRWFPIFRCAH